MRARQNWSLYKRKVGAIGYVYYYRTYDEFGQRTVAKSTGKTSKTLANDYCANLFRAGKLIPTSDPLFSDFAEGWWIWGTCDYLRGRLERSAPGKPSVSERYGREMLSILNMHLLPAFKNLRLSAITAQRIEHWALKLRDTGLSGKRVNDISSCLRIMLTEAHRLGRLDRNPFDAVRPLGIDKRDRGVLTLEEVQRLFLDRNIKKVWNSHTLHRTINLVAACTGCRMGELLALKAEDVHAGWLHIAHSWNATYGLGPTKTRQVRDVPIASKPLKALKKLSIAGGFVFSMDKGKHPIGHTRVSQAFYEALEKIGITPEQRAERNITFHSWRHWLNSVLRARAVPDPLVRRVTGHTTEEMTEHYTRFVRADFAPVLVVQEEVFA
jgi:integrase